METNFPLITHLGAPFKLVDALAENAGTILLPYRGAW